MRQRAIVTECVGVVARVKVIRSAMCEGCAQRQSGSVCACSVLVGTNKSMVADAVNEIGAKPGDMVEVETDTKIVLRYAVAVFLLPIVAAILLYALAEWLFADAAVSWIAAAAGFLIPFAALFALDRKMRRGDPQIRIVTVISTGDDRLDNLNGE